MVQDKKKKNKKNKNKNKNQANETPPEVVPQTEVPAEPIANGLTTNANQTIQNDESSVMKSLTAEASQWTTYNWAAIQDAEAKYQTYLATKRKAPAPKAAPKADEEEFDLFASDEEPAAKPAKAPKKAGKAKEQAQPKSRTTSESDKKSKSRTTSESKGSSKKAAASKVESNTYLNVQNDAQTLVLLKPDAVHRNLMGDIICKFEERGFKLAALKFVQASENLLKNHYADLAKKPFFPELVRYMMSGPIVAMVWTGLNIVPMVRAMVGATKPSDAAPGSIRGDLCVDVGRNLIHASDSVESAQKEVASWFPEQEIVQWRPCSLEWTYEDEVVEEDQNVDGIAAMAGGANADVVKKLKDLEIENKNLKKVTDDLKSMVLKLENRVAALEKGGAKAAPAPAAKEEEEEDEDVDLFGSESEEEDDAEKDKIRQERLAAYAAKKAKKPKLIAKTSVLLDVKPWDDETDMDAMLKSVKTIEQDGLLWGASKLVPVGYGISKLSIICVVEDEKVSIEELQEKIEAFEDFVQSCDVASMQKI